MKLSNVPTVEELRKAGNKVRVLHHRQFGWQVAQERFSGQAILTRFEFENPSSDVWIAHNAKFGDCLPIGGYTEVVVTTPNGTTYREKYNVGNHPFVKKKNVAICIAKMVGKADKLINKMENEIS